MLGQQKQKIDSGKDRDSTNKNVVDTKSVLQDSPIFRADEAISFGNKIFL